MQTHYSKKQMFISVLLTCIVWGLFFSPTIHAQQFQTVKDGVEYLQIARKGNANEIWSINLLRIDLTKADIQAMRAMDEAVGLETTSSLAQRYDAIAAINGGYFRTTGTYRGDSAGVLQVDGKILSESFGDRAAVGFVREKNKTEIIFGHLKFEGFIKTRKQKLSINGINCPRVENQLILYTPEFTRTTLTDANGVEVIVKNSRVISIADKKGSSHIPENGFVFSAIGTARDWVLKNLKVGARVNVQTKLIAVEKSVPPTLTGGSAGKIQDSGFKIQNSKWQTAEDIVGGGPQLIKDGKIAITLEQEKISESFSTTRHPRTAIAKLKDGKVLLVAVDGRQPNHSVGMSLTELANLLLEFGATDAINLDGGGSTTMIVENKVVNKPSDQTGERSVSDALLVFLRKRI
jgi:exopolysaccharide biosynthesis protein